MFVGRIEMQNAIDRKRGIEEVLAKAPGLELLPVFLDQADRGRAKQNVEDALARHPDLVLALGLWSYNGPCIAGAVRASTRAQKPLVVAFDEEEETLKAVEDGLIAATIVQKPYQFGYQSMRVLAELHAGKQVPPIVDTGLTTVTRENLASFWRELRELKR
jgi:ribose transport system substrate-binding protein